MDPSTFELLAVSIIRWAGLVVVTLAMLLAALYAAGGLIEYVMKRVWHVELVMRTAYFLARSTVMPPCIGAKRNSRGEWISYLHGHVWPQGDSKFHASEMAPAYLVDALDRWLPAMRRKLSENVHKGDSWLRTPSEVLYGRVIEELAELKVELDADKGLRDGTKIRNEAADVANMVMMLADIHDPQPPRVLPDRMPRASADDEDDL